MEKLMKKFALALLLIASTAFAEYPSGRLQRQLEPGMSLVQVIKLLGEPDSTGYDPKGSIRPENLSFKYISGPERFSVTFVRSAAYDVWIVQSWNSY